MSFKEVARKKKKALRVVRDKKFRRHSRHALSSASRAALRAKRVSHQPSKEAEVGVVVAGVLVAASLGVMVWRSLRQA